MYPQNKRSFIDLEELIRETKFSKGEIRLYQNCPYFHSIIHYNSIVEIKESDSFVFFTRILILQFQALPLSPGWYRDIFRRLNACVHIFINLKIPRMMYRGFKQECPNGAVNEDTFKEIYEKFFPYGSKQNLNDMPELIKK